jgi:hypothetical protein
MKKIIVFLSIQVLFISCAAKKNNDKLKIATLLYLASNQSVDVSALIDKFSDINSPQGKAAAISNIVSSVASSASSAGNVTPKSNNLDFNTIMKNGLDPIVIKNNLQKKYNLNISSVSSRSVTYTDGGSDSNGNKKYTFSGTTDGYDLSNEKLTRKVQVNGEQCADYSVPDSKCFSSPNQNSAGVACNKKGTSVITNGEYTFPSYSSSTEYTYSSKADIKFTDFGTFYFDPMITFVLYKKLVEENYFTKCPTGEYTSSTSNHIGEGCTCTLMKSIYDVLYGKQMSSVIDGDLSFNYIGKKIPIVPRSTTNNSDGSVTTKGSFSGNFTCSSDSKGLKIVQNGTDTGTFSYSNLLYSNDFKMETEQVFKDKTYISFKISGNYKITLSGVIKGETLNETFNIVF